MEIDRRETRQEAEVETVAKPWEKMSAWLGACRDGGLGFPRDPEASAAMFKTLKDLTPEK